jgi:hypothetical protein
MPLRDPDKRRAYHSEYMRTVWYPQNKAKHIALVNANRDRIREDLYAAINRIKESKPCMDCFRKFPAVCMDFDHVRGIKRDAIATMINNGLSLKSIMAEIEKCEVVCANCHRIRTDSRLKQRRR